MGSVEVNAERRSMPQSVAALSTEATDCKHYGYSGIPAYLHWCSLSSIESPELELLNW